MKAKNKKDRNCNYYNKMMFLKGGEKRNSGVSPILGMIFVILITMTIWSAIQSTQVPKWLKTVEIEHSKKVEATLKKMIEYMDAGMDVSIAIKGVKYPTIPFFMVPPPPYMVAHFEPCEFKAQFNLTNVSGVSFSFGENYSILVIDIYYNFIDPETFVLDNGALYKVIKTGGSVKVINLAKSKSLEFILINGTSSSIIPTQEVITLRLEPASVGDFRNLSLKHLEFTSYNKNTTEKWKNILKDFGINATVVGNKKILFDNPEGKNVTARFIFYITSTVRSVYESSFPPEEPRYNGFIVTQPVRVTETGLEEIKVLVLDQYGNPLPNFALGITSECSKNRDLKNCAQLYPPGTKFVLTDKNGIAHFMVDITMSSDVCGYCIINLNYYYKKDKF